MKRDRQTVNAHNVDEEVAFISLPRRGKPGNDFVYDNTAGTDQTIYIVDTGAGLDNNDVNFLIPSAKTIWLINHKGVFQIRCSEQKIPPSHRRKSERWAGK